MRAAKLCVRQPALILSFIFILLVLTMPGPGLCAEAPGAEPAITVQSFEDTQSAGWAHKKSDVAFVARDGACRIQWNVVLYKEGDGKRDIIVTRQCSAPMADRWPLHRAIAKQVFARWPVSAFGNLLWGSFCRDKDWSWCVPVAVAASKSADYADYRKNYPDSKIRNLNGLYVQLADETDAYKDLRQLFKPYGADVRLTGVEKVFAGKVHELPPAFASELKRQGVKADTRVMYDVGSSYFKIFERKE